MFQLKFLIVKVFFIFIFAS